MSEGPIKRERDAWKPVDVSNGTRADTVHAPSSTPGRAYCGRKAGPREIQGVTCSDCLAALAADGRIEAGPTGGGTPAEPSPSPSTDPIGELP